MKAGEIWCFGLANSRTIIGNVVDFEGYSVTIKDPVQFVEVATGGGPTRQVQANFAPYEYNFEVEQIELNWMARYKACSKKAKIYKDTLAQIRTQKAGIIVPQMASVQRD